MNMGLTSTLHWRYLFWTSMSSTNQLLSPGTVFKFKFIENDNSSARVIGWAHNESTVMHSVTATTYYDSVGAIYYVIAVIIMFSCTIFLMFCSFVRKSRIDNSIISYMKDLDRLERLQLKQEKFRTNLQIHQKKVHRILGPDRAEVLDETISPSPSMQHADMFGWDPDMLSADAGSRRPSSASLGTIIICADDLQQEQQEEERVASPLNKQHRRRLSAPAINHSSTMASSSSLIANKPRGRSMVLHEDRAASQSSSIPKVRVQVCD